MAEKLAPEKRHVFMHNGQKVFEWDQTLEEVNIYIDLPPGVNTKLFSCKIQSKHIEVGIKGNPPYMNHDLAAPVKTDSSFWTIEDGTMHLFLQKRDKGQTWSSPIQGQGILDPYASAWSRSVSCYRGFRRRIRDLTFLKLSSVETALILGHSWVGFTLTDECKDLHF